jgi:hypothetical protein
METPHLYISKHAEKSIQALGRTIAYLFFIPPRVPFALLLACLRGIRELVVGFLNPFSYLLRLVRFKELVALAHRTWRLGPLA